MRAFVFIPLSFVIWCSVTDPNPHDFVGYRTVLPTYSTVRYFMVLTYLLCKKAKMSPVKVKICHRYRQGDFSVSAIT